jgi:flagellar hook-associated protein 3 FlgL
MTQMSSLFRVTAANGNTSSIANIAAASNRLAALQNEMSSDQAISRPSDNPDGTVQAMQLQGQLARNTQYTTNSNDAMAWLSTADSTYSQSVSVLQQARTLVVQALNTGSGDASSANAIADQITGLRNTLLSLANTSYNGRPIFGGTTASGTAYDASGNYVGDTGAVTRQISTQSTVSVSAVGTSVFGAAGSDAFTMLANIASTLKTNPTSLSSSTLAQIDAAISTVSGAQSMEGASYKQVQAAQTTQTATGTALQTQIAGIENPDLATIAIQLSSANISYQAALQTTASIRQMSLLNFLQ